MSPKNCGVLQFLKEVTFLRILVLCSSRKGCFLCGPDGLVGLVREIVMSVTSVGRSHPKMSDIVLPFPLCTQSCQKMSKCEDFY